MTEKQQRDAARAFVSYWGEHGDEKQDTQRFWMDLLQNVLGVENPSQFIEFEVPVMLSHTSFIDGFIPSTRVLIEQKGYRSQERIPPVGWVDAHPFPAGQTIRRIFAP